MKSVQDLTDTELISEVDKLLIPATVSGCSQSLIGELNCRFKALRDSPAADLSKVSRVEVIDHSPNGKGRAFVNEKCKEVTISMQDDDRTLKVFIK